MKSALLAISLTALTQMGFAGDVSCGCCEPCQPKIDQECYVPEYYNLECDCGVFVSADFLYWYERETKLPFATKNKTLTVVANPDPSQRILFSATRDFEYLDSTWDPGVRAALGFNTECDGWDIQLTWTYYRNTKSDKVSVNPFTEGAPAVNGLSLSDPWTNTTGTENTFVLLEKISTNYKLRFNQLDFELGRKYWLSRCFTMRPFTAIRFGWTETQFSTEGSNPLSQLGSDLFVEVTETNHFTNCNWGVGLLAGLQPSWYFTPCFSIFGSVDLALLWGDFKTKKRETFLSNVVDSAGIFQGVATDYQNITRMDVSGMQGILDLALGLRFETTFCNCEYRIGVDAGWEHHVWFSHNRRFQVTGYDQSTLANMTDEIHEVRMNETNHNLEFGGLVVRLRFDF